MNTLYSKLLLLFAQFLIVTNLLAQFKEAHPTTGKWALVEQDGYLLSDFEYDKIERRSDTCFIVHKGGMKGMVDGNGNIQIPIEWAALETWLQPFVWQNGFVVVSKNARQQTSWGMVNSKGKLVLPLKFDYVRNIFPDLHVAREPRDTILQFFNGKGELLFKTSGRKTREGFDDKTFKIERLDRSKDFVYADGSNVFPDYIEHPSWTDGKYIIAHKEGRSGVLNWQGATLVPFEYDRIKPMQNGEFLVQNNNIQSGLVDENGEFIIPMSDCYLERRGRQPGDAFIADCNNGSYSNKIYDAKGNLQKAPPFRITSLYKDGSLPTHPDSHYDRYFLAQTEGNLNYIYRMEGTLVLQKGYHHIKYYSDVHPIIVQFKNEDPLKSTYTALNFDGKQLLPTDRYYNLSHTANPRLLMGSIEQGKRHGFIHLDNPEAADMKYKFIKRNYKGFLFAELISPTSPTERFNIFDPAGRLLTKQLFYHITDADKNQVKRFQKDPNATGRLIAVARQKDTPYGDWIGINKQGQTFYFSKKEKAEIPAVKMEDTPVEDTAPILEEIPMETPPTEDIIYKDVDKKPEYVGGEKAMGKFISQNLQYPNIAMESAIQGTVTIEFVVDRDGSVNAPKIIKDIGGGCGREALRLVNKMPKWKAAMKNKKAVRTWHSLDIKFELN